MNRASAYLLMLHYESDMVSITDVLVSAAGEPPAADGRLVQCLCFLGVNPNVWPSVSWAPFDDPFPLAVAATYGHTETVQTLLAYEADIEFRDSDGYTALAHAASKNRPDALATLLRHGANPNAVTKYGTHPLVLATTIHNAFRCVQRLLDAGADLQMRDSDGETVAELILRSNPSPSIRDLVNTRASTVTPREAANTPDTP